NYCFASRAKSCSQCLQAGKGCAYCPMRCFTALARWGGDNGLERHEDGKEPKINMALSQSQVSPQLMTMSFLPGEEKTVDVEVFAPTKGPLDLYILMDFSNSMADDLDSLKSMGEKLAKSVHTLSDNFTIGFGKFVDKVIEPQTDMRPEKLAKPWPDSDPPFSFQNVIKLTHDVKVFNELLQDERISGNLDAPEGGFDAILQAAVCKDQIGWRDHSTHLLVFSTESAFHYETDGMNVLSGILKRNDEQCHLDAKQKYTQDIHQDYPSIPTLIRVLGDHNIIPVFAVTNHSYTYYEKLKEYFPIAEVGRLTEDSSNMLQIMEIAFKNIRSKMSIRAANKPKAFETEFLDKDNVVKTFGAFKFNPGEIGKFKLRVKAHRMLGNNPVCESDEADKEGEMRVKPTTFNAGVNIKASVLCPTCDCEKTILPKADICHKNGNLVCGTCQCSIGWLGTFCNCSASTSAEDSSQCIAPGMKEPCSDRGDCLACGVCVCYNPEQFEGPYCQYDKTQCLRHQGFLCNDHGSCVMGGCACAKGWEGNACECPKSTDTCRDSKGVRLCNGRGDCVCGLCVCPTSGMALTATCEPNFQALAGACEGVENGRKKDKEKCDTCPFKITLVDELKEAGKVLEHCSFRDEDDDCTYQYTLETPEEVKGLEVQVLEKRGELRPAHVESCLALLPCCRKGRMVGFKEDEYLLASVSAHLGSPRHPDGEDRPAKRNRHRPLENHRQRAPTSKPPAGSDKTKPQREHPAPDLPRLNRLFSENLSRTDSKDAEQLRKEVSDNLNEVYKQIPGAQKVQKNRCREMLEKGRSTPSWTTVLTAPRSTFPDIVKLTEKNVQSGNVNDLKVVPGYYTVATDREAVGAVEFQEGVESIDVHVPLFVKDEDDDKKQLLVEAVDVPLGIAGIGKRLVNITIIKEHGD
ncbi:hypothetical protein KUCAC02_029477, partial [Chaenocephalus aceratus]